jgi:hypothetical protein
MFKQVLSLLLKRQIASVMRARGRAPMSGPEKNLRLPLGKRK